MPMQTGHTVARWSGCAAESTMRNTMAARGAPAYSRIVVREWSYPSTHDAYTEHAIGH